jgi:hypothetical protein
MPCGTPAHIARELCDPIVTRLLNWGYFWVTED